MSVHTLFHRRRRPHQPGSAPGVVHLEEDAPPPVMRTMTYDAGELRERTLESIEDIPGALGAAGVVWLDIVGLGSGRELEALREALDLHPLAVEDVASLGQRPKVEPYDGHLFIVARMARPGGDTEQVSLFVGDRWIVTVQEREGDPFDGVRRRLREGKGRLRQRGADYLAYALLDAIVDSYFPLLEAIGDRLQTLEENVLDDPDAHTAHEIHEVRRTLVGLRRAIVPHRDAISSLIREDHEVIGEETVTFLRDVWDHVLRIMDLVETLREVAGDLMSVYLTVVSNRMNEIMKVLTIIATIFIPLGFIAGLYGMNFDPDVSRWNMPELRWRFGYPFALSVMTTVAVGFLVYMWRRGWLR